jgi:hypothetical protein
MAGQISETNINYLVSSVFAAVKTSKPKCLVLVYSITSSQKVFKFAHSLHFGNYLDEFDQAGSNFTIGFSFLENDIIPPENEIEHEIKLASSKIFGKVLGLLELKCTCCQYIFHWFIQVNNFLSNRCDKI